MSSIPDLTTIDQASQHKQPPSSKARKRIKHAFPSHVYYATHSNAPTLSDVKKAAAGAFARLLVTWVNEQGQGGVA